MNRRWANYFSVGAFSKAYRALDVYAAAGTQVVAPIVGRLVERGSQEELKGTAYAIVEGVDGRTHHLRFADLELTGDAGLGAVVEVRSCSDANGRKRLSLATWSDLTIDEQASDDLAEPMKEIGGGLAVDASQVRRAPRRHPSDKKLRQSILRLFLQKTPLIRTLRP